MGGTTNYVYRDGQRLTPAMLHDLEALDAEFYARTGEHLVINEGGGIRTHAEQVAFFTDRYRRATWSPFGDYRRWDGSIWGRVKGATTAAPGLSNHQINVLAGRKGALDLSDTGNDPGILTRGSHRARVFDEIAGKYGFDSEGYAFGENWHKRYNRDPWRTVARPAAVTPTRKPAPTSIPSEEDDMNKIFILERHNAQLGKSLYDIRTGKAIRPIGVEENTAFRKMQATGDAVYITVDDAEYKQRGGK